MKTHDNLIHPEDSNNIRYWTKKWGVSQGQLIDAILSTGSLNPVHLKEHLKRDVWYHLPFLGLARFFKSRTPAVN